MNRDLSQEAPADRSGWLNKLGALPASIGRRLPRRLTLRRPRLTRLRLAILGVIGVLFVIWAAVAISSTSIYSTQLVVVDGNAIGIPPPDNSLDFGDVPPGGYLERSMQFENNGSIPTAVMILEWGGVRDLVGLSDAFFTLDPGDEKVVTFEARPPASAEAKKYTGKVVVVRVPWWLPW